MSLESLHRQDYEEGDLIEITLENGEKERGFIHHKTENGNLYARLQKGRTPFPVKLKDIKPIVN